MTEPRASVGSPTVAAHQLAVRLRTRRLDMGVDVAAITRQLGVTRPYWSAIENARTIPAPDKLRLALDLLGFDAAEQVELMALRDEAKDQAWWDKVPRGLRTFVGLEQGAVAVRTYEVQLVTGLLQTADYARALAGANPSVRSIDVEAVVSLRLARQRRLSGPDPLRLTTVMSEAALMQHVGPPQILLDQLRHLLDVTDRSAGSIDLRIAPFGQAPGGLIGSSTLYLLDFASPHLHTVLWFESANRGELLAEPDDVRPFVISYDQALRSALPATESLALVAQRIGELERTI